jgi:hypothetical protein
MKFHKLVYLCSIILVTLSSFIFRACGGNPAINRPVSQTEITGEWHLDNSSIERAKDIMVNVPEYAIKDSGNSNRILIREDGSCEIGLINLASYKDPEYFEKFGQWNLTNIPYKEGSDRANNIITLPWKADFAFPNMRMSILEEDGNLVLYHYLFRDGDMGVIVKYRRQDLNQMKSYKN